MKTSSLTAAVMSSFRVAVAVEVVATEISAYDNEAACRYARESIEEVAEEIQGKEVDLRFRDGKGRKARFDLPTEIEPEAELTDGEEGDPEGTMAQGEFEISIPASVSFDVEAPVDSDAKAVLAIAGALIAKRKGGKKIVFDTECLGDELRLISPLRVSLAK